MSQCPICNASTWIGQRYCSTCDSYLPNPEEEDHFCPQCHIRVGPSQELCHKCNARLPEIAGASFQTMTRPRRLPPWVRGIFIGTGLVIVVLIIVLLFNKNPGPPQLVVAPPSPPGSGQTPAIAPPRGKQPLRLPRLLRPRNYPAHQHQNPFPPPELTTPTPSPPMYFVNTHSLALRDGLTMSAPQIATLNFTDQVELLDTSGGWGRIREVRRNIVGWSNRRYLVPVTADHP